MLDKDNPSPFGVSVGDDVRTEEMEALSPALGKAGGLAEVHKVRLSKAVIMFDLRES